MVTKKSSALLVPEKREQMIGQLCEQYPQVDSLNIQSCLAVMDVSSVAQKAIEKHFARYDLTQGRYMILLLLFLFPRKDWTASDLAENAAVTRPMVIKILRNLEIDGYIERIVSPKDRRIEFTTLSRKGQKKLETILPDHFSRVSKAFAPLSEDSKRSLLKVLTEVKTIFSDLARD